MVVKKEWLTSEATFESDSPAPWQDGAVAFVFWGIGNEKRVDLEKATEVLGVTKKQMVVKTEKE